MTKHEFIKQVTIIYFRDNCKYTAQAIGIAIVEFNISDNQFRNWFGRSIKEYKEGVEYEVCPSLYD